MKLTLKKLFYVSLLSVLVFPLGNIQSFAATTNQTFISDIKSRIKEAYGVNPQDITVEWKDDDISKKISELQKFYPGKSISIEVKDSVIKDRAQDRVLQLLGYKVLRYTGSEIVGNVRKCANEIKDFIWEHEHSKQVLANEK